MIRKPEPKPALSRARFVALAAPAVAASVFAVVAGCGDRGANAPSAKEAPGHGPHAGHGVEGHGGQGHEGHGTHAAASGALVLSTEPAEVAAGRPVRLRGMIHRDDGSMVKAFEETHEKLIHLIVVREGLDHFAHLHPEVDDEGNFTTDFTFPAGGRYFVYADYKPKGEPQTTARGDVHVAGSAETAPKLTPNAPGRVSGDGLTAEVAVKREADATEIAFELFDESGEKVSDLEPYLGAPGHLVILSANGEDYVHAHPSDGKVTAGGPVRFAAHFAGAGLYKGWAQFQRSGRVLTVPFVLRVEPSQKT